VEDVEAPDGEKWEYLKSGGKQWQVTPKNLPRTQRTRAIPVAWLNSGLCPDQSKGWIPVIIICLCISSYSFTSSDNVEWQQYEFRNLNKEGQEEHGTIRLMCIWIWYKQQES